MVVWWDGDESKVLISRMWKEAWCHLKWMDVVLVDAGRIT